MEEKKQEQSIEQRPVPPSYAAEDEIDLLELWAVIWKWRRMIAWLTAGVVVLTVVVSLLMTNMYKAEAVIVPVSKEGAGSSGTMALLASQLGGLPGIALPGGSSAAEIVNLLKSNIVREKLISRYNLLPVLFPDDWDAERKRWKAEEGGFSFSFKYLNPMYWVSQVTTLLRPTPPGSTKKTPGVPDVWDGLRALEKMIEVKQNVKENSITVSAQFDDHVMAARLVEYLLTTLTDHMSAEARRVAQTNQKYLESQLATASDPFIKQKIYNLIAQQIETSMMAEVKENFAFKVLDPPKAPDKKFKPKRALMAVLAFVTALFLGVFAAFFLEFLEKRGVDTSKFLTGTRLGRAAALRKRRGRRGGEA